MVKHIPTKMQVLAKADGWEVGVLLVGVVYLQHGDEHFSTEDSPIEAARKIPDVVARKKILTMLLVGGA